MSMFGLLRVGLFALTLMPLHGLAAAPSSKSAKVTGSRKVQPLELALSLQKQPLAKRMAFTEKVFADVENPKLASTQRARMILASALVFLNDKETRLAAVDLLTRAAKTAPLQLNSATALYLWQTFFKNLDRNSATGTSALKEIAVMLSDRIPAGADASHSYYLALARINEPRVALALFSKVEMSSEFYRPAKLHEGLIQVSRNDLANAKKSMQVVISLEETDAEKAAGITKEQIIETKEIAVLNLARLHFESKEFREAISLYRSIDSESSLFYESLTEQGWAFFMAGHPNRALGVGYGATSPHFNQQFQPEQYFLGAVVNYWLCDFAAARANIQEFVLHTREEANQLRRWSDYRKAKRSVRMDYEMKMFAVVEGMFQGVSHRNNVLGPRSLQTLGRNKTLHQALTEIADIRNTRLRIAKSELPNRTKRNLVSALIEREKIEQRKVGKIAMSNVELMRSEYERTLGQIRFIHLEIMTAEKDRLMDNDRSTQGQQFLGSEQAFLDSVGAAPRVWQDKKREFWKDELDSFVFNKKSQCKQSEAEERQHATK